MKLWHLQRCGWTVIQSEVNQKEKKQVSHINAYTNTWNLEKWYR